MGSEEYDIHKKGLIFKTVCHDGEKYKLYYYTNSNLFVCFTDNCGTFDIYTLIEKVKGYNFYNSILYIQNLVNKDVEYVEQEEKDDELEDWKIINKFYKNKYKKENEEPIRVLDEKILEQYIIKPNIWLKNEGVDEKVQKEFKVGFDLESERIVIPIFSEYNLLIGIKGRSVYNNEKNKYIALYSYPKSEILYGLHYTFPYIKKKDMLIIVEGEKTLLQLISWGYNNVISISGKNISSTQFNKILQLNVPICLALDKDVDIELLKKYIKKFKKYTTVYIIFDKWNKLKNPKSSPTDEGKKIWEILYKNKFKY